MHRYGIILLGCSLFLSSCSVSKQVRKKENSQLQTSSVNSVKEVKETPSKPLPKQALSTQEKVTKYLSLYGKIAQREMRAFKIPASITLAQGLLESGFGQGRLAIEANNHFGIKCHREWNGKRIYHDDDEKGECFRVYDDPIISYRDHSLFLVNRTRYAFLFRLGKRDYKAWAMGLKKAGYATDPKYPDKLIRLIERFDLDVYDTNKEVITATPQSKSLTKKQKRYVVQVGDTLYSIAKRSNSSPNELKQLNKLKNNNIYIGQELILPKP